MQIIPDHLILYLQLKVLGTLFSAIAYGIMAVLSVNCLYLLQRKRLMVGGLGSGGIRETVETWCTETRRETLTHTRRI